MALLRNKQKMVSSKIGFVRRFWLRLRKEKNDERTPERNRYLTATDKRWTINKHRLSTSIRTITKRHFATVPLYSPLFLFLSHFPGVKKIP